MGKVKTIYDRFMTSNIPVTQIETSRAWNLRNSYYIVNRFRLNFWEVKMKEYSMEPSIAGQNTLVWDELTSKRIVKRAHWYMKGQRKQPCACCQRSSWMWFVSAVHILHVFFFSFVSRHNFFFSRLWTKMATICPTRKMIFGFHYQVLVACQLHSLVEWWQHDFHIIMVHHYRRF